MIKLMQYNKLKFSDFSYYSKITISKTTEYIRFQAFRVLYNVCACVCVCVSVCVKKDNIFSDIALSFYYESTTSQILNNPAAPKPCSQGERRTVTADSFLSNAGRVVGCYTRLLTQYFSTPRVHCQGLYKFRQTVRSTAYYGQYHTSIG